MRIIVLLETGLCAAAIDPESGTYDVERRVPIGGDALIVLEENASLRMRGERFTSTGMLVLVRGAPKFVFAIPFADMSPNLFREIGGVAAC